MQAAGGLVGLAGELAAGVERAEDHLQRRLAGELRVRVDRDAAAVVADGDGVVGVELDLDAVGVAGDGLVHGVVEDLGDEVVQRALVGAADIHAGALADRLQPLEHLDGGGVVGGPGGAGEKVVGHRTARFIGVARIRPAARRGGNGERMIAVRHAGRLTLPTDCGARCP